jgi:hypothetical protein
MYFGRHVVRRLARMLVPVAGRVGAELPEEHPVEQARVGRGLRPALGREDDRVPRLGEELPRDGHLRHVEVAVRERYEDARH